MNKLLLLSNSQSHGRGYLDHAEEAITSHFAEAEAPIAFIPFAIHDREGYGGRVRERFSSMALETVTVTADAGGLETLRSAGGIFVGGGNTFRLLRQLRDRAMLPLIRERVAAGVPYMGSSAGSGIAAPTIKTSNDMPIVDPGGFDCLGLVSYQLNLHFIDADPDSTHMGETRELRLTEYLEENETPVVALREGAWIMVEGERHTVGGGTGGLVFQRGQEPLAVAAGDSLAVEGTQISVGKGDA